MNEQAIEKKIILVTGATGGIGKETALHLARLGHRVLATGRKTDGLEALEHESRGLSLETFRIDLNDAESIAAAKDEVDTRTEGYGLDVLVNNAGFGLMAPMELITGEDMRSQFETNLFGLVALTQRFLPAMRERRSGRIINVSSVVGRVAMPMQGVYSATKFALEAVSDALRIEVRGFGVSVSLVEPGTIRTHFEATAGSTVSKYQAMESPYPTPLDRYRKVVEYSYKLAPGPKCIVKTIEKIVRSPRPGARYVSPWRYHFILWFTRFFPTSWFDRIMQRVLGVRG